MRNRDYRPKNKEVEQTRYRHSNNSCSLCGGKTVSISTNNRYLSDLEKKRYASIDIRSCLNPDCELYGQRLRPTEFLNKIMPYSGYGIDVYAEIGRLRIQEKKTIQEIHQYMVQTYSHLEISERHVENIVKSFMLLLQQSGQNAEHLAAYFRVRGIEFLYLSADGIQPEKGNDILYVVREVNCSKIVYAKYSMHSDTDSLKSEILQPLKKVLTQSGLQVGGWISDKESSLSKAIVEEYPHTPFQHCQSHFLAAIKEPVKKAATALGKTIKKNSGVYGK